MLKNFSFDWYRKAGRVINRELALGLVQRTGALHED